MHITIRCAGMHITVRSVYRLAIWREQEMESGFKFWSIESFSDMLTQLLSIIATIITAAAPRSIQ